jgi:hypothetical protein
MIIRFTYGMVQYTNLYQLQEQEQINFYQSLREQVRLGNSILSDSGTNIGIGLSTL